MRSAVDAVSLGKVASERGLRSQSGGGGAVLVHAVAAVSTGGWCVGDHLVQRS